MKITLISTATFPSDQGIRTISAVLKKQGHDVKLVFMTLSEDYSRNYTKSELIQLAKTRNISVLVDNMKYVRNEDMSPDGTLSVLQQPDGDIAVTIDGYSAVSRKKRMVSVEFCAPFGGGGGRSKHTREALIQLAHAIEKDNLENPITNKVVARTT